MPAAPVAAAKILRWSTSEFGLDARTQNRTGYNGYSSRWLTTQSGNPDNTFAFDYAARASTPAISRIRFGWENSSRVSSPAT